MNKDEKELKKILDKIKKLKLLIKKGGNVSTMSKYIDQLADQKEKRRQLYMKIYASNYYSTHSAQVISVITRYNKSDKGKKTKKKYQQSEKGKTATKRYNDSIKGQKRTRSFRSRHKEDQKT